MTQSYFIAATGTGIGKTLVTSTLAYQLLQKKHSVSVIKPVISGYDDLDKKNDTFQLLASQGLRALPTHINAISPWRFKVPLAPSVAAMMEDRSIDMEELLHFCQMPRISEYTLLEGAGGVMAPITSTHTICDWMTALQWPVILVAGTYLGSISHTLTAAECLRQHGLKLQAVIVSESLESAMSPVDTATLLKPFIPDARYIVPLPRMIGEDKLWVHMPDLTWCLL